jgi:hypothetical protein
MNLTADDADFTDSAGPASASAAPASRNLKHAMPSTVWQGDIFWCLVSNASTHESRAVQSNKGRQNARTLPISWDGDLHQPLKKIAPLE